MTTRALALTDLPAVPEKAAPPYDWAMTGRTVCCFVHGAEVFRFQLGDVVPEAVKLALAPDAGLSVSIALAELGYSFESVAQVWHQRRGGMWAGDLHARNARTHAQTYMQSSGYFITTTVVYPNSQVRS